MNRTKALGFTLIELVITIVLLAILAIATSDFIRSGSLIFRDSANQQVILGEARFVLERIKRELFNSLPNSARVDNVASAIGHPNCLTFVPAQGSSTYVDLPITPSLANTGEVVTPPNQAAISNEGELWLANYILSSNEILDASGQLLDRNCSLSSGKHFCLSSLTPDASSSTSTLTFSNVVSFAADSPSQRYFLVSQPVRYCYEIQNIGGIARGTIMRYQPANSANGVLMASLLEANSAEIQQPFRVEEASLTRNGLVNVSLRFKVNNDYVEFNHDMVVPNQP